MKSLHRFTRIATGILLGCGLALGVVATAPAAVAEDPVSDAKALAAPIPKGNDWNCKPSSTHPYPVVLVHGTSATGSENWSYLAPQIADAGYCVYALNYGDRGMAKMEDSSAQLKTFVTGVLAATSSSEVDLVGHSQGGLMPRYYLRFLGGAAQVDELIGLGAPNHGTNVPFAEWAGVTPCQSCPQFKTGSAFLTNLNAGGDTDPGVYYTNLATKYDQAVQPYTSGFMSGSAAQVTNVTVQDKCPNNYVDHVGLAFDPVTISWIMSALGRTGPADAGFTPSC